MEALATDVKSQLGHDVMDELVLRNIEGFSVDVEGMDVTDHAVCETVTSQEEPDAVIHCVAYTAVDATEDNLELCRKISVERTCNITRVCKVMDIKIMYTSTNCVFNSGGERPWEPDDRREPLNVYGLTECESGIVMEQNVQKYFVVRIVWVFGISGRNFIKTMLRLGKEKGAVSVINNQIGSLTYICGLVRPLVDMIQTDKYGRYHATNEGLYS